MSQAHIPLINTVLDVQQLCLTLDNKTLLNGVSFTVQAGQCVALVGESGSGKSLTALACVRLLPENMRIASGEIVFNKTSILDLPRHQMTLIRGKKIGFVFQDPSLALNPVLTIGQQLIEALSLHIDKIQSTNNPEQHVRALAVKALHEVGILDASSRLNDYPFQFSGGQKQRIMIAIALAGSPDLLIADEPTTALDVIVQAQILNLLKRLQVQRGMALLLITHDLNCVRYMADTVVVLQAGKMVESSDAQGFFAQASHPHSQALLSACTNSVLCIPPQLSPTALLTASNLTAHYKPSHQTFVQFLTVRPAAKTVLEHLNLSIMQGETLALLGASGSGKTTFAKILLSLYEKNLQLQGQLQLLSFTKMASEKPTKSWQQSMSIVFQDPYASFNPRMRVGDSLMEGLRYLRSEWSLLQCTEKIHTLMQAVEMPINSLQRWPHEFSGGQRQRLAIVRALVIAPKLLILDEPSSALDSTIQAKLLQLLARLQREFGYTYLIITHNFQVVKAIAQRVAVLHEGQVVEHGLTSMVLSAPQHEQTKRLLVAGDLERLNNLC